MPTHYHRLHASQEPHDVRDVSVGKTEAVAIARMLKANRYAKSVRNFPSA